ncbi:MAG: toll/interleukin-1 receptor domain-containing protein [Candidatus Aminicenantes bacterium]|nr:MAG: toll/interleukin-1 receptor domain-containing protein [Candidatus Aminicenantes bacterium]
MSKIFISYSHKDEPWKDKLVEHLQVLELEGYCTLWDDRKIKVGDEWFPAIEKALQEAHIAVMLISVHFLTSNFIREQEVPRILERWRKEGLRMIPLIVEPCAWKKVEWLAPIQLAPKDGEPLSSKTDHEINEILAKLAEDIAALIKSKNKIEPENRFLSLPPEKVSTSKLPTTGPKLFGREKELERLDAAWKDEHTCLVTLIAWGGVGKTALVNHWLNIMAKDNYRGAGKVYGWSFYSQGAEEGKQASADEFLYETLKWFNDPRPDEGTQVEKGRRLARLVGKEKTLLILDGMEPLQCPPGEVHGFEGKLKDQGMRAFLRELTGCSPGLCVITSRERVTDLEDKLEFSVKEMPLDHLSAEAGALLLRNLGVEGTGKEILKAVQEYDGHALALTLLGNYIKSVFKGDIRKRDSIPQLTQDKRQGRHARRVMEAYTRWLGESPERDILYIMGLFDRPVEMGAIEALKADPPIPGVTEQLQQLTEEDWGYALDNLRGANLLAEEDPHKPDTLDCHPLIREHFGERFQQQNPAGWKEAHQRLYHYFKDLPEKELPDTLLEMEPLFAAVAHGCKAGLYNEARYNVFSKRIRRLREAYIIIKLGAFGAYLSVISHFFEKPWSQPADGLTDEDKGFILSEAAFGLRSVGRLQEALHPMKAGLEMNVKRENWLHAAINASNLSELLLTLGEVNQAVDYARQSVAHADLSGDWEVQIPFRTTLADALHQSGQLKDAEKWFREAEEMQKQRQPEYKYLYSFQGSRYCDLLLRKEKGTIREVKERISAGRRHTWTALSRACGKLVHTIIYPAACWRGRNVTAGNSNSLKPGMI